MTWEELEADKRICQAASSYEKWVHEDDWPTDADDDFNTEARRRWPIALSVIEPMLRENTQLRQEMTDLRAKVKALAANLATACESDD